MTNNIYIPDDANNMNKIDFDGLFDRLYESAQSDATRFGIVRNNLIKNIPAFKSYDDQNWRIEQISNDSNEIAALKSYLPRTTIIDNHFHNSGCELCLELVICTKGHIVIYVTPDEGNPYNQILKTGDYMLIPKGFSHTAICIEDTELICITVPADPDFSDSSEINSIKN